ncbi:lysophospholipid acyltransferase family protein [Kribbia dieselivorans]|uniref:lysophospholipid acyltransferase family protein n=1 Tax=Kribbia dieselivorans TaxID=331526 RepID=UPI000837ED30|nr:lysophospholipid acyltransferase family protein [Kribbia dieselivorans]
MLYWFFKHILIGPPLRLLFPTTIVGDEHLPESGPVIVVSNHLSFSDSFFLPLHVKRRMTFLAKSEYFTKPGLNGWFQRSFFGGVGQLPIDRSGGRASQAALDAGLKVLGRGDILGLYPEGTRSPDGRLHRGRTGAARMALETGAPVVPVAMINTEKAQPTGQKIPKLVPIGIHFGEAMDFSRYEGMANDHAVLRAVTDEIMYALMELSGQEYVDVYASTLKDKGAVAKK